MVTLRLRSSGSAFALARTCGGKASKNGWRERSSVRTSDLLMGGIVKTLFTIALAGKSRLTARFPQWDSNHGECLIPGKDCGGERPSLKPAK